MGGSVMMARKRNGQLQCTVMSKHAASALANGSFFQGTGDVHDLWDQATTSEPFAPEHYGLVVVDFDNQWVGSCQGYSHFQKYYPEWVGQKDKVLCEQDQDEINALWQQGRVVGLGIPPDDNIATDIRQGPEHWIAAIIEANKNNKKDNYGWVIHVRPPPGWRVDYFDETAEGCTKLLQTLVNRGFEVNIDKAEKQWQDWLTENSIGSSPIEWFKARQQTVAMEAMTQPASRTAPRIGRI